MERDSVQENRQASVTPRNPGRRRHGGPTAKLQGQREFQVTPQSILFFRTSFTPPSVKVCYSSFRKLINGLWGETQPPASASRPARGEALTGASVRGCIYRCVHTCTCVRVRAHTGPLHPSAEQCAAQSGAQIDGRGGPPLAQAAAPPWARPGAVLRFPCVQGTCRQHCPPGPLLP